MIDVTINGVRQISGVDYTVGEKSIMFSSPPSTASLIDIRSAHGTVARILGDGHTYLFPIIADLENYNSVMNLLNDAAKYYDTPAVADVLERLRVVVELVKQDDNIRKR